jgi:phosphonate transport system ATP-binding protein
MHHFRLENVTVRFGPVEALRGVSLSAVRGEQLALVGPSGSGKSTLLRLLAGAVAPESVAIHVAGQLLANLTAGQLRRLRSQIGFIHQHLGLGPNLRVSANIAAGRLGAQGFWAGMKSVFLPGRRQLQEMESLLGRVGLTQRLHSRTDHLSGGQQQRVAIARALWQQPQLLVADEPVSSLDPARARAVLELLVRICREDGLSLIVSLHQLELARALFPRLVGLRAGRIVFDKPAADVGDAEFHALYDLAPNELDAAP